VLVRLVVVAGWVVYWPVCYPSTIVHTTTGWYYDSTSTSTSGSIYYGIYILLAVVVVARNSNSNSNS